MITAKVHGMAELHAKLIKMMAETPELVQKALIKAAKPIEDYAVGGVPVDSGGLGRSIHTRLMPRTVVGHETVRIGPAWAIYNKQRVEYGRFVEYGTSKMPAHPFLRPALDVGKDAALRIFKAEMKKALT